MVFVMRCVAGAGILPLRAMRQAQELAQLLHRILRRVQGVSTPYRSPFFFFIVVCKGWALHISVPSSSPLLLSILGLNHTKVFELSIRALIGTDSHFCDVASLEFQSQA